MTDHQVVHCLPTSLFNKLQRPPSMVLDSISNAPSQSSFPHVSIWRCTRWRRMPRPGTGPSCSSISRCTTHLTQCQLNPRISRFETNALTGKLFEIIISFYGQRPPGEEFQNFGMSSYCLLVGSPASCLGIHGLICQVSLFECKGIAGGRVQPLPA